MIYDALPSETTFNPKDKTTWQVSHWIDGLHNALKVKPVDPKYDRAQAFKDEALSSISDLHALENHAASIAAAPGGIMTALQALGTEATMGAAPFIEASQQPPGATSKP